MIEEFLKSENEIKLTVFVVLPLFFSRSEIINRDTLIEFKKSANLLFEKKSLNLTKKI